MKDENLIDIKVGDGKYQLLMGQDYHLKALRHGENWRDLLGDKLVYCLASELQELREKIKAVENCLICVAIADPAEVCENALKIIKQDWS